MVLLLRMGVENLAIWKCTALYYYVDYAQEVHDIDVGWLAGVRGAARSRRRSARPLRVLYQGEGLYFLLMFGVFSDFKR